MEALSVQGEEGESRFHHIRKWRDFTMVFILKGL